MAASPIVTDGGNIPPPEKWEHQPPHDQPAHAPGDAEPMNGGGVLADDRRVDDSAHLPDQQPAEGAAVAEGEDGTPGEKQPDGTYRGEKQIKPNKVYIGGLPEHTRKEDLESCFGKIGSIVNIELKVGYGFVEFDSREAAEESVAKYHEGYFMGNKIRVELSRGGGRTAKYGGDPGACFKCGQVGHWARECPNHSPTGPNHRPGTYPSEAPLIDRIQPPRDYPPRDYPPYRDDYARYPPPPRDPRYYDYPPPPGRDYRRPPSPSRDYRDYPPPVRSSRELDDYRVRGIPPPPPPARYDSRPGYYPPEGDALAPQGYPPRVFGAPPPVRDYYDRYDRRAPPPADRYGYPPPAAGRPRTPPGAAPRGRDDFDRPPPRDYPPPPAEYRGRPVSPPPSRFADYPPRAGSTEARYRRRSQSPPPRSSSGAGYDAGGYPPSSAGPAYNGASSGYAGNGYPSGGGASSRGSTAVRDYPPRAREGEPSAYRRN